MLKTITSKFTLKEINHISTVNNDYLLFLYLQTNNNL